MKMLLQDKLDVMSVCNKRTDWMWLIKMTCSSAFLNYLILVKRLGVLVDYIGLNQFPSWYQSEAWQQYAGSTTEKCRIHWRKGGHGNSASRLKDVMLSWAVFVIDRIVLPYLIMLCRIPEVRASHEKRWNLRFSSPRLGNHHSWSLFPDIGSWSLIEAHYPGA